jgi:hypothetical protein
MTVAKLELSRWHLVRCTGNMALDIDLGAFKTREEAVETASKAAPGLFALWFQVGKRPLQESWEELML